MRLGLLHAGLPLFDGLGDAGGGRGAALPRNSQVRAVQLLLRLLLVVQAPGQEFQALVVLRPQPVVLVRSLLQLLELPRQVSAVHLVQQHAVALLTGVQERPHCAVMLFLHRHFPVRLACVLVDLLQPFSKVTHPPLEHAQESGIGRLLHFIPCCSLTMIDHGGVRCLQRCLLLEALAAALKHLQAFVEALHRLGFVHAGEPLPDLHLQGLHSLEKALLTLLICGGHDTDPGADLVDALLKVRILLPELLLQVVPPLPQPVVHEVHPPDLRLHLI
mmetsp:Transcript_61587/g.183522  ORF Transcript_61587/g.183522 Transcript_61587/m.183522 type:complete len:275 (+) Transcript_61587:986-1810(+)